MGTLSVLLATSWTIVGLGIALAGAVNGAMRYVHHSLFKAEYRHSVELVFDYIEFCHFMLLTGLCAPIDSSSFYTDIMYSFFWVAGWVPISFGNIASAVRANDKELSAFLHSFNTSEGDILVKSWISAGCILVASIVLVKRFRTATHDPISESRIVSGLFFFGRLMLTPVVLASTITITWSRDHWFSLLLANLTLLLGSSFLYILFKNSFRTEPSSAAPSYHYITYKPHAYFFLYIRLAAAVSCAATAGLSTSLNTKLLSLTSGCGTLLVSMALPIFHDKQHQRVYTGMSFLRMLFLVPLWTSSRVGSVLGGLSVAMIALTMVAFGYVIMHELFMAQSQHEYAKVQDQIEERVTEAEEKLASTVTEPVLEDFIVDHSDTLWQESVQSSVQHSRPSYSQAPTAYHPVAVFSLYQNKVLYRDY